VGVIVLGPDQEIDFANTRARDLLGAAGDADVDARWRQLRPTLANAFHSARNNAPALTAPADVTIEAGALDRRLRIQIHQLAENEYVGHLLVIQEAERAAAIDAVLRHAVLDRGLSSLFSHVAHDLKGLLNVMTMNVEILSRISQTVGALPPDQAATAARCASVAQRELARLDRTLGVVLDRSAIEQAEPRRFDLRPTCQALAALVAARASRQHVAVALELPDEPVDIIGRSDRVYGAILNLLINALDAMPDGGTLRLGVAHAGHAQPPHDVRVTVCDTGPGVDPDLTAKIWGLHYSTKLGGTGLGLYVTRAVAEAHGGRVSYHRNPDGGACFVVELPTALRS
jgi:signal transduction histidine kinase